MSVSDEDIKTALKPAKTAHQILINQSVLCGLAQLYLSVAGKMPEEKTTFYCADSCKSCAEVTQGEDCPKEAHNKARQACILNFVKMLPTEEELEKIIEKAKWDYNAKILNGEVTNMASKNYAKAVYQRMREGSNVE